MKRLLLTIAASIALGASTFAAAPAAESEEGFTPIFDGKSFTGWKMATESTNSWSIRDGAIVASALINQIESLPAEQRVAGATAFLRQLKTEN